LAEFNPAFKVKLYNKLQALKMLCQIKGLLKDRDPRGDEIPDSFYIVFNRDVTVNDTQKT